MSKPTSSTIALGSKENTVNHCSPLLTNDESWHEPILLKMVILRSLSVGGTPLRCMIRGWFLAWWIKGKALQYRAFKGLA